MRFLQAASGDDLEETSLDLNPVLDMPPTPDSDVLHPNTPFLSLPHRLLTLYFHDLSALMQR